MPDSQPFTCIIFCPVCCTPSDAEGLGDQEFVCSNCSTSFTVEIRREVVASHSMY